MIPFVYQMNLSGSMLIRIFVLLSVIVFLYQLKFARNISLELYSLHIDEDILSVPLAFSKSMLNDRDSSIITGNISSSSRQKYHDCPFKDSSIVESIYVYPHPGSTDWKGDILSDFTRQGGNFSRNDLIKEYPWIANDLFCKTSGIGPYEYNSQLVQFNTELLVRDIITHPDSCLRTQDPEKATLFYVPYLPSAEFHNGSLFGSYSQSIYANAIQDIITEEKYELWETTFGLTSHYWKRRNGSDHILVFSEPMHGLWHPKNRRGNFHFLNSQFQTHAPIVISNELSKTFVDMYPMCARKNILMPYPNTNGRWFNGKLDNEMVTMVAEKLKISKLSDSPATIQSELELENQSKQKRQEQQLVTPPNATVASPLRILGYYYNGGNHGSCTQLRRSMKDEFQCSASGKIVKENKKVFNNYAHAYRQSTFCPCPGGDSPSAKRNFDALLAGCIPIILSEDFVWPFTTEFDRRSNKSDSGSTSVKTAVLNPDDFSIRLRASDHEISKFDSPRNCTPITDSLSLQSVLEAISSDELARLRRGVALAADAYSYYTKRLDLPDNPLREGVLPEGGAAHLLVRALEERASGALWDACQREMVDKDIKKDSVRKFKC